MYMYMYVHIMYVHIYIDMHTTYVPFLCICICTHPSTYTFAHVRLSICMHVCVHAWRHACRQACMYVGMYVCMYVRMHVCMHACMCACMLFCWRIHQQMHKTVRLCLYLRLNIHNMLAVTFGLVAQQSSTAFCLATRNCRHSTSRSLRSTWHACYTCLAGIVTTLLRTWGAKQLWYLLTLVITQRKTRSSSGFVVLLTFQLYFLT